MTVEVLEKAIRKAKGNARVVGKLLREICAASPRAAALIEQDLANPELSLDGCWQALKAHAKKHQSDGFWGCAVFGADPENEVVKVVLDYYKIPAEWLGGGSAELAAQPAAPLDLMSLL